MSYGETIVLNDENEDNSGVRKDDNGNDISKDMLFSNKSRLRNTEETTVVKEQNAKTSKGMDYLKAKNKVFSK